MTKILLIILLCYGFCATAQPEKTTAEKADPFLTIKLDKFPIADFPSNSIPVSGIRLIQVVNDSINLGYGLKGNNLKYSVVMLKPAKPLTDFLQEHIARMYKNDFSKEGAKLLWVLKDLHLGERISATGRYIYTRLKADSYISPNGDRFKKIFSMDTVLITESYGVGSSSYGMDIENAFKVLLKRSLKEGENTIARGTVEETFDNIVVQSGQVNSQPIFTDPFYKEGAYISFQEFIQNKPSVLNFESTVTETGGIRFIKPGSASADTLAIWGVCQKGEIFKYHEGNLIPIEKQGNGFIISDYVANANSVSKGLSSSRVIGGLVGGVVGGLIVYDAFKKAKGKPVLLVKSIPYINEPGKQPEATCIDMETGEFSF